MNNSFQLEREIYKLIKYGLNKDQIIRSLAKDVEDQVVLEESVDRLCDDYPDYERIQYFMKSKVIIDKDGEDNKLYLYNPVKKKLSTIDKSRLTSMVSPKLDWSFRRYTCDFVYDPLNAYKLKKIDGDWRYNLYEPPFWQEEYFHSEGKTSVPKEKELPLVYRDFFIHLVNNDLKSYDYLIDWLANMLQARNRCVLTTIGSPGIGKGRLGNIMEALVGADNYTETGQRVVAKEFNSQILNKRLIYLDEVDLSNVKEENVFKSFVNEQIEIERKGKDPFRAANYASIYYSSNNLDSIRLPDDDRRFSIVELTDIKLAKIMSIREIESLTHKENITKLAHYLYHKKYDAEKMQFPFRSERTELIRAASLNRWQEYFLEEYAPGKAGQMIPFKEVQEAIEENAKLANAPGRTLFGNFCKLYLSKFRLKNIKEGEDQRWYVVFAEEGKDE